MTLILILSVIMQYMLSITGKSFMPSVIMPSAIMLSAIMLSAIMLSAIMLSVIMMSVIMLNVVMLSVVTSNLTRKCTFKLWILVKMCPPEVTA